MDCKKRIDPWEVNPDQSHQRTQIAVENFTIRDAENSPARDFGEINIPRSSHDSATPGNAGNV
jgi:hypothetical protein